MKKLIKTLLAVVLVVAILLVAAVACARCFFPDEFGLAVATVRQFGVQQTVKLAYDFVTGNTLDEQTFKDGKTQNDKQLQSSINDHGYSITDEQLEQMNSGNLTEDEIADILLGKTPQSDMQTDTTENITVSDEVSLTHDTKPDNSAVDNKTADKAEDKTKPEVTVNNEKQQTTSSNTVATNQDPRVAKLIAKMYVLKGRYTSDIEGVIGSMKGEYLSYPAEQRTTSLKANIATKYMNKINAMEAQCDAQVDAIVKEIRDVLRQTGSDESLADSILTAYNSEKASTKSYYIGKYAD